MPELPAALAGHAGAEWLDRYAHALLPTYGVPQRALVRGDGAYVWDADGRRYLDLLGGIATNVLGHAHPTLVGAVSAQLATLGHVSNFFASPQQVALAERLLALLEAPQGSRVFLANSGAEANEGAFKVARRTGRPRILALEGAFHGRTMGALALTHKADYREPFAPLPGGVEHVPAGDLDALEAALDGDVAALFVEVIQGEAGVRPLPEGYLAAARELTAVGGCAAGGRRGADRGRSHRPLVRAHPARRRPGRRHGGQGTGRRHPGRRDGHARRAGVGTARRRSARHHVRRQPGARPPPRWPPCT